MTAYCVENIGGFPEFEVVGPASLLDLAMPVAHALRALERQGVQAPRYDIRARRSEPELTPDERNTFTAALEKALDELKRGEVS